MRWFDSGNEATNQGPSDASFTVRVPKESCVLDGSQDRREGNSVLRTSLRMRKYDDSVAVEDEVAPELAPVLTAMQMGDVSLQQRSGVEEQDVRMCVGPQKRRSPESKASVGASLRITGDHEWQTESVLKPGDSLSGLERDDHDDRLRPLEPVLLFGHLHEMAFAQQSPDVAKEGQMHRRPTERGESEFLSIQRGEAKVGRSIARFHQSWPTRLRAPSIRSNMNLRRAVIRPRLSF